MIEKPPESGEGKQRILARLRSLKFDQWWMVAIIALVLGVVAGQVMVKVSVDAPPDSLPTEGSGGSQYPELLRNSFMDGCVESAERDVGRSDATQICNCMVEKLEASYSLEDFISVVSRIQGENLPPSLQTLLTDCVQASKED